MTAQNNIQTAETILQQLGGNRFMAMTGSKNLVAVDNGLMMQLVRNKSKANKMRITLTPMDTYKVEFFKITRDFDVKMVKEFDGVYFDQLQDIFTEVTGLYTRM